jgi:hypothetical protein
MYNTVSYIGLCYHTRAGLLYHVHITNTQTPSIKPIIAGCRFIRSLPRTEEAGHNNALL